MALLVEADLELVINGQPATLTGSGKVLRLTLSTPRTLRALRQMSLPNVTSVDGRAPSFQDAPGILAAQGLTLEGADQKGLLLILGRGAEGKSFSLPGFGREHLKPGSRRAAVAFWEASSTRSHLKNPWRAEPAEGLSRAEQVSLNAHSLKSHF